MRGFKIQETQQGDRPRERLRDRGAKALSSAELLAILLRTGRKGVSAVELGQELIRFFGGLEGISRGTVAQLARITGIGETKAIQILAAFEVGLRLQQDSPRRLILNSSQEVWNRLGTEMRQLDQECVKVMVLNVRRELLAIVEITRGILNESLIHPREIFRPAFFHQGYGIIVVHNHPSGDPTPSASDHRMTRELMEAGKLLDIPLLDHVILGNPSIERGRAYFSFHDAGLI